MERMEITVNCPCCGEEMRAGYIQSARSIIFSDYEKALFIVKSPFNKEDRRVTDMLAPASPAFYCDACDSLVWKKNSGEAE